jgi:hypothetical protein
MPSSNLNDEVNVVTNQSLQCPYFCSEKVSRAKNIPVRFQKTVPVQVVTFRCGLDPLLLKDVGDGCLGSLDTKVLHGPHDSGISPGRIFQGDLYDHPTDLLLRFPQRRHRSLGSVLKRDQFPVPRKDSLRCDKSCNLSKTIEPKTPALAGQSLALGISELDPPVAMKLL